MDTHTSSGFVDAARAISPTLTTTEISQQSIRPYTPRPRTPRTSQASRSSKYPEELSAQPSSPRHHAHQHRYEGFEELLREAGYKETRIFTPERERISSKTESAGKDENQRPGRGSGRAETTKLRSVVGFLAGFLVSGNTEQRNERGPNTSTSNPGSNNAMPSPLIPSTTTTPSSPSFSTSSSSQSLVTSSPNLLSPGTPQGTRDDIHMNTPTPTNHPRNNAVYSQSNASYTSIASSSTTTQPKYLRSAHMQHKRRQSGGPATNNLPVPHHALSRTSSFNGRQPQHSDMLPPPVPPLPVQYRDQNLPLSRPGTPSHHSTRPTSRAQSRPSTPTAHPHRMAQGHSTPIPRDSHSEAPSRLRHTQTEPLPTSPSPIVHPTPSRAHAYLRHMASAQKIFEGPSHQSISLGDSVETIERPVRREGEDDDTPKPRLVRPRSTPGGALKGLNLWASFTSSASVNSTISSGSSGSASHSTSATSPQTSSSFGRGLVRSPEQDDGSEPDEEAGGYFNLIRSRSQSRSRAETGRPHLRVDGAQNFDDADGAGPKWWRLRQTRSMMQVKLQEEDEGLGGPGIGVKRRRSYLGVSHPTPKPMVDSTNLAVPMPSRAGSSSPSPALPYLVTRLSSPAPPETTEHTRGRVQEKKTRVYCRSQSVPRRRASGRGRWGLRNRDNQVEEAPVPILMANTTSDTESIDERELEPDTREQYLSGQELDTNATAFLSPPGESTTPTPTLEAPSPPPRQNSIRSLRRHLKLDEQQGADDVPPVPVLTAGRGQSKPRGGLPGGWLVG
ncbi:hypothetical protein V5O48_003125 [Marasmius crinis-equi]|uniref:Uncharacterized protein n=1 Tax=Marasmius crinis-equi TaxID=585013 RepID=A0ABR3FU51_9AGAR